MPVGACGTGVHALASNWVEQDMGFAVLQAAGCLVLLRYWLPSMFLSLFFPQLHLENCCFDAVGVGKGSENTGEVCRRGACILPNAVWDRLCKYHHTAFPGCEQLLSWSSTQTQLTGTQALSGSAAWWAPVFPAAAWSTSHMLGLSAHAAFACLSTHHALALQWGGEGGWERLQVTPSHRVFWSQSPC